MGKKSSSSGKTPKKTESESKSPSDKIVWHFCHQHGELFRISGDLIYCPGCIHFIRDVSTPHSVSQEVMLTSPHIPQRDVGTERIVRYIIGGFYW
jgi:hypothetical protein